MSQHEGNLIANADRRRFAKSMGATSAFAVLGAGALGATSWGRYYDGDMKQIELQGGLKLTSHFSVSGSYATNRADYHGVRFATHEISSRLVYAFSNRANLQVFGQWNNESRVSDIYVRLHIIPKIGSDLYGVFNQLLDTGRKQWSNIGRAVRGKMIYPFYR